MVEAYRSAGAVCHRLPLHSLAVRKPRATWTAFRSLVSAMRQDRIDVTFTSQVAYTALIAAATRVTGTRSAIHLGLVYDYPSPIFKWATRTIDLGVTPSEHTARGWRERGWPDRTLRVIPNGIDLSQFDASVTRAEARAELQLPPTIPIVGYVGRLVAAKGIFTLMRAFAAYRRTGRAAYLLFVGDSAGQERQQLVDLARAEGLADDDWSARGSTDVPQRVYRAADVVVLPAEWDEPFGLVPLEAAACGTLVIVSDRGILPEFVIAAGDRAVFPSGSAEVLSARLAGWLSNASDREAAAARLSQDVRQRFSFERCGDAYLAAFDRMAR